MRIIRIEPAADPGRGKAEVLAFFDLELTPELRLYNLKLVESDQGLRTYTGSTGGRRNITFAASLADKITSAAVTALKGLTPNATSINH